MLLSLYPNNNKRFKELTRKLFTVEGNLTEPSIVAEPVIRMSAFTLIKESLNFLTLPKILS